MSFTFTPTNASYKEVNEPCDFPGCVDGNRCGYCDDGEQTDRVCEAPTLNLANSNARGILMALGKEPVESGQWEVNELGDARQRVLLAKNKAAVRGCALRDASESGGPGTGQCKVIVGGYTDAQVFDRLCRLDDVLAWGQEHDSPVQWA
jgi:hypothetical protein